MRNYWFSCLKVTIIDSITTMPVDIFMVLLHDSPRMKFCCMLDKNIKYIKEVVRNWKSTDILGQTETKTILNLSELYTYLEKTFH
jgi:hypothetical protein